MKIAFINVGYGDAILIEQEEMHILVDTGSGLSETYAGENRIKAVDYLLSKGISKIDYLVISHIHEDHVGHLPVLLENISVKSVCIGIDWDEAWNFPVIKNTEIMEDEASVLFYSALATFGKCMEYFKNQNIPVSQFKIGEQHGLPSGLFFQILGPTEKARKNFEKKLSVINEILNDRLDGIMEKKLGDEIQKADAMSNSVSLVLKVCNDFEVLLPGDAVPSHWENELKQKWKADLFKLPHHGQIDSFNKDAMEAIQPEVIITTSSSDREHNSSNPLTYKSIMEVRKLHKKPEFIFTDEADYLPYFNLGRHPEAVKITKEKKGPKQSMEISYD